MNIAAKAYSAVRWTAIGAAVRSLLQLFQMSVLARILGAEQYGVIALTAVFLGFSFVFSDLGLGSAYIQRREVSSAQRSSLFWANIFIACAVAIVVSSLGYFIADFYDDQRLSPLLMIGSLVFIISAAGQQVKITAEKQLNFRPVAILEISGSIVGFLITIVAVFLDCGIYSLVLGSVVASVIVTAGGWFVLAAGWRPSMHFKLSDLSPFIKFGGSIVGNGIINNFNRNIDLLIVGRIFSAADLGHLSVPRNIIYQMQSLINPIITRVGFPLISHIQSDIEKVRSVYAKTLLVTSSVNAPLYVGMAFYAEEIVYILLGPGWSASVNLMRILAAWGFVRSAGNSVGGLLQGLGKADLELKWNLFFVFIAPAFIYLGSHFGILGLAWSLFLMASFSFIPLWYFLVFRVCGMNFRDYVVSIFKPLLIAIVSIGISFLLTLSINNNLLNLSVGIGSAFLLYWILSLLFNKYWASAMIRLVRGEKTALE